jgi:NAD(P)-dependent dehydrogenase (short-subunit alcohol dehydrogenase family)
MTGRHQGRVAFVTGAGSGIGRATAARLASEGARVAVVDVRLEAARETAEAIAAAGGEALALRADVRSRTEIEEARDRSLERFGAIAYLVNNAGLVRMSALDDLEEEEWDLVLDTNLNRCTS